MSSNIFAANVYHAGNVIVSQSLNVATLTVTTSTSTAAATFSATPAAAANVLTVIGSSTTGNVVQFSNTAGGNFIMTNAGRVGISTTSPAYTLDVTGDVNLTGTFRQNGAPYIGSQWTGTSAIYFAGNVGIGTTTPSQKLHVAAGNVYVQETTASVLVNRLYVAIQDGGYTSIAASSTDGFTWTQRALSHVAYWRVVTVNPVTGVFVALASDASSSTDGINWTQRAMPQSTSWAGLACNTNTGIFSAVSENSGYSAYSTNGITWVAGGTIFGGNDYNWQAMAVNPNTGIFVAVCFAGPGPTTVAASSADGINWVQRTMPASQEWRAVTCNPTTGVFVAVGALNFGSTTVAASSADGINWVQRTIPNGLWRGVTVNPTTGVFVAVSASGPTYTASSTDGFNWVARNSGMFNARGVTCNPNTGGFVIVNYTSQNAASSTDGIFWTARTLPGSENWRFVTTGSATVTSTTAGFLGLGVASPSYQLDLSTDSARKLTTTTWATGSDSRIKTDIETANLQTCYDVVKSVDLKYFKWNFPEGIVPDDRHSLGFIAQEVKSVFPNAVSESNSYGYEDFLSLNVDQIDKALFGAVKHLSAKVEALEQSLASAK